MVRPEDLTRLPYSFLRLAVGILGRSITLYRPYARHLKPGRNTFWSHPFDGCDLVLESGGGTALTSFVDYVQKWNPNLGIAHHTHMPASVKWAVVHDVPCAVLTRNADEQLASNVARFRREPAWLHRLLLWSFEQECRKYEASVVRLDFYMVTETPDRAVRIINERTGANLCEGDGRLRHLESSAAHAPTGDSRQAAPP